MTNKLRYFVANWKMYGDLKSLKSINKVIKFAKSNKNKRFKLIYCPPYTLLSAFCAKLQNSPLSVGAQNCHEEIDYGAFTGNVNAKMIKNLGAKYIILGHSENSANGDTDITINKKINSALKQKLTVIFCIGETLEQRQAGKTEVVLRIQLEQGLTGVSSLRDVVIAYEPVWAIGTGEVATPEQAQEVHADLRSLIENSYNQEVGSAVRIQYGGSVNPSNAAELLAQPDIDGALVGGAALDVESFNGIIQQVPG